MAKHEYVIKVEGRIVNYKGDHYAQGWAAGGIATLDDTITKIQDYSYKRITHSVEGDLILDGSKRIPPYAIMSAAGGICDLRREIEFGIGLEGGLVYLPGFDGAFAYYHDNIDEVKALLNINVGDNVETSFIRGLYVDVFSIIELFLGDYLLCGIFTNDEYYENCLKSDFFKFGKNATDQEIESGILDKIEKIVFHDFDKVRRLFKEILNSTLPDSKELEKLLHKRHNIVHRFSYSNIDRIRLCIPTREDVRNLIDACDKFVSDIRLIN